ncbi:uncharacterized protein LAJ45_08790 [Morchella importuna]|uniref:uncharacterized protein n=1 Tax=Morchella importuna TaxID=1174673 RepID=UPI001E8D89C3|nr:uncharacterized protein LAJ45_08790 [Morchella importuna]KAH8147312.1 hypothetical protein LAJ45_08790 [Morchella importuna]
MMVCFRSALIAEQIAVDQNLRMVTDRSAPGSASRAVSKLRAELKGHESGNTLDVLELFKLQRKTYSQDHKAKLDWAPLSLKEVESKGVDGQSTDHPTQPTKPHHDRCFLHSPSDSDLLYNRSVQFTKLHDRCFFHSPDKDPVYDQIESADILGLSPIHYAASPIVSDDYSGDKTYVSVLLRAGADGNVKDLAGWTPLHYNCLWGGEAQFGELMSEGLDIETRARDGMALLHCAAIGNNHTAAKRLMEAGLYTKVLDSSRNTPLHWAAYYGNLQVRNVLLQAGGVRERNNDGRTPAHLAALGGHVEVLKVMLGEVSSMEDKDRSGCTILHLAAAKGHTELVDFLVRTEEVTDSKAVEGVTPGDPESECSARNDANAVSTRSRSNIEAADARGFRALHWAANTPSGDSIGRILVSRHADIHATDLGGRTPLNICVLSGNAELARYLIDEGAKIDPRSEANIHALHHVAKTGNLQMLKALFELEGRLSVDLFHLTIKTGNIDSIKFLISEHANMAAFGSQGATALHIATETKKHPETIVQLLADHGADLNSKDRSGQPVVHKAIKLGQYDLVKFLIERKVDLDAQDKYGNTAVHVAVLNENDNYRILKILAKSGPDVTLCNNSGRTALHEAARLFKPDLMPILVGIKGADINMQDVNGKTALHYIASLKQRGRLHAAITLLAEKGADLNLRDKYHSTPIHTAAMRGEKETVYAMIDKGANLNAKDNRGRTILHIAARNHDCEMIACLADLGAKVNTKDNRGNSAIHCTVAHNLAAETILRSVEALTDEGANINSQDSYGRTILHLTLITIPKDINELLRFFITQSKANVWIKDKLERTILHYSSLNVEISLVRFFLTRGPDLLNALDANGYTALHFACFEGKPDLVRFLLDKGADFGIRVCGWTPLHLVILSSLTDHQRKDCVEIAYTLIERGVDKSCKDQDGRTALDMAVILEAKDLLQVFHSDPEMPNIPLGSDEGVSEIAFEQAIVGERGDSFENNADVDAIDDEDVDESIDGDDGESSNGDAYDGNNEDVWGNSQC